ncbi:FUSC family protein [Amycolatopsis sp. K13G38]|uniref:FUSC family protein n=2 Tax=Amycolatopsis acididurans TaxID=2724524 RepID=A0ABX1IXB7_9PSEU|nr:FUSC family protein [Amycolatopsis acididurans]
MWDRNRDRLVASDPGLVRLRLAGLAVSGIVCSVVVLAALGRPLPTMLVAGIASMQCAFTVNDRTPRAQAVTLVLACASGALSMTVAAFGATAPPLDSVLFILLIFFAVYAQRFAPRGNAIGALAFFMFFFSMFLQIHPAQLGPYLTAIVTGVAANAFARFVLLRRSPERELVRVRKAFRARLGAVARAAAAYLAGGGTDRRRAQLRRADSRLHEAVMMIEDTIGDVLEPPASELLRRRAIEVELAAQWLSITTRRTSTEDLPDEVRDELAGNLVRFESLIEHDPRELPVISDTDEFSKVLVAGSRLDRGAPGDELRRAIAELALADVNAQRIAEHDYSAEVELPEPEPPQRKKVFAYDNRTRSAVQATIAGGLAVLGGELVSHQRWYWAVLTVFVVFLNTSTAGATFVKGLRRVTGTLVGIFGGMVLAFLVTGDRTVTVVLLLACVFGIVYTVRISQLIGSVFITCMLGLLYSLLGTFSFDVLWLRVAETAIGAVAGILAAVAVLPVRTRTVLRSDMEKVLANLHDFLDQSEQLLSGRENVNVIEYSRELDRSIDQVRTTVEPLTHPISLASRRDYGSYVLTTLDRISFRSRLIAARAEPGMLAGDDRLTTIVDRLTANIDILRAALGPGTQRDLDLDTETRLTRKSDDPGVRSMLISFGRLDEGIIALGKAFEVPAAESVQVNVRRRTVSEKPEADRVRHISEENVRRSTQ